MAISHLFTNTEVRNTLCQLEWFLPLCRHLFLYLGRTATNDIMKEVKLVETWFNNSMLHPWHQGSCGAISIYVYTCIYSHTPMYRYFWLQQPTRTIDLGQ